MVEVKLAMDREKALFLIRVTMVIGVLSFALIEVMACGIAYYLLNGKSQLATAAAAAMPAVFGFSFVYVLTTVFRAGRYIKNRL